MVGLFEMQYGINYSLLKGNCRLKVRIIYVGGEIFKCKDAIGHKLEWCIGATATVMCAAGQEEGFIFRGVGVRQVQLYCMVIKQYCTAGNMYLG